MAKVHVSPSPVAGYRRWGRTVYKALVSHDEIVGGLVLVVLGVIAVSIARWYLGD